MPQAIVPIIMAATAAIGTGVSLYNMANAPSPNAGQPTPSEISTQAISAETMRRNQASQQAAQWLPNLQADTSGGLSPDALRDLSSTFSGNADIANSSTMQNLIQRYFGIDQGASYGGSSSYGGGGSNPLSPGLA